MNDPSAPPSSSFHYRAPSQTWETVPVPWAPGGYLWAWYKPVHAPTDLIVRIPDELQPVVANRLTMRHLLSAVGLAPAEIICWSVQGMTLDAQGGMSPLLDQPLPPPVPWADASIGIRCQGIGEAFSPAVATPVFTVAAAGPVASAPMTPAAEAALASMDTDWNAIQQMESQLSQLRKQLNTVQGRLQSLNRDFSPEERQAADSNDVKNWQDARRFLRDAAGHVSRYIREFDVGTTSAAGQRNRFEEIYKSHVAPRKAFEGIAAMQLSFEAYRKQVQALLAKMQTALSNAGSNGEQRAQQVLNRINAKMKKSRNRE